MLTPIEVLQPACKQPLWLLWLLECLGQLSIVQKIISNYICCKELIAWVSASGFVQITSVGIYIILPLLPIVAVW